MRLGLSSELVFSGSTLGQPYCYELMRMFGGTALSIALILCSSASGAESGSFGKNLYPGQGITIQQSTDGLERTIKLEQSWLGEKYGPIKFICEASSTERLLRYLAEQAGKPLDDIKGKDLLPKGTYRYAFPGKTWEDRAEILKDVMDATGKAFALNLEISRDGGRAILNIKPKQN